MAKYYGKNKFSKISSIIKDAKRGKIFILVDDKNRENEGDLVIPGLNEENALQIKEFILGKAAVEEHNS